MKSVFFNTVFILFLTNFLSSQVSSPIVTGNNQFALNFLKANFSKTSNAFFSPYSISSALAMTYAGARNETEKQMELVFGFTGQDNTHENYSKHIRYLNGIGSSKNLELAVANAVWKQSDFPFEKDFLKTVEVNYKSPIFPLTTAEAINTWTKENTNGKIKKLVSPDNVASSRMILTNAIYFKGDWSSPFTETNTKKQKFYGVNESEVDMMFQEGYFKFYQNNDLQILQLPYEGNTMNMSIVLPKPGILLNTIVESLSYNKLNSLLHQTSNQEVRVHLPKFKFETNYLLKPKLAELGMPNAFDPIKANFSGISPHPLFIDNVIHKAFIEVNEKGSEAAAATAVLLVEESISLSYQFMANRPFLFIIRDTETNTILFLGCVQSL
jgi:serpin B